MQPTCFRGFLLKIKQKLSSVGHYIHEPIGAFKRWLMMNIIWLFTGSSITVWHVENDESFAWCLSEISLWQSAAIVVTDDEKCNERRENQSQAKMCYALDLIWTWSVPCFSNKKLKSSCRWHQCIFQLPRLLAEPHFRSFRSEDGG